MSFYFDKYVSENAKGRFKKCLMCNTQAEHKIGDCPTILKVVLKGRARKTITCSKCHNYKSLVLFNCTYKRKSQNSKVQFATVANTESKCEFGCLGLLTKQLQPNPHKRDKDIDIITIESQSVNCQFPIRKFFGLPIIKFVWFDTQMQDIDHLRNGTFSRSFRSKYKT